METQNVLLSSLTEAQIEKLSPLEPVTLRRHDVIYRMDDEVTHLYFLERGFVSLIRPLPDSNRISAWNFDGTMVGSQFRFLRPATLYDICMRVDGHGWRVPRERLLGAMLTDSNFASKIVGWMYYFDHAVAKSAACQMSHTVEQRLCRLLQAAALAVRGGPIDLNLSQIADMLPAARAHVYRLAEQLEAIGAIRLTKRRIEIIDRTLVAARSCVCFEAINQRRRAALQLHGNLMK
jgi:CRP-like cAMP-binding protein